MPRALPALGLIAFALAAPAPALAEDFEPVTEEDRFLQLIEGRELRLALFGIGLRVLPDGQITGQALGTPVTGQWSWQGGYFCRELQWGARPIPANCQLVEARGEEAMRFTVDRGAGQSAEFRLR